MEIKTLDLISQLKSETKLEILSALYFGGSISVNEIVRLSGKNRKNVSKQVNEMIAVGILVKEVVGRFHLISFNKELQSDKKEIIGKVIVALVTERRKAQKG